MEMDLLLKSGICNALNHLYGASVEIDSIKLEPTNADFKGDFTFVTFPYLKVSKKILSKLPMKLESICKLI